MRRSVRVLLLTGTLALGAGSVWAVSPAAGAATGNTSSADLRRIVHEVSVEHGMDPRLVHAVVTVESGYNPRAVSRKGALGLMQLMPDTARRLAVKDPFDPVQNVRGGVRELARLMDRYVGDLPRALAAYNAGEGAVDRYRGVPPFRETRRYVERIMTLYTGRPFDLGSGGSARPVKLVRDGSGRVVITNSPPADRTALARAVLAQTGGRGLAGGFGK